MLCLLDIDDIFNWNYECNIIHVYEIKGVCSFLFTIIATILCMALTTYSSLVCFYHSHTHMLVLMNNGVTCLFSPPTEKPQDAQEPTGTKAKLLIAVKMRGGNVWSESVSRLYAPSICLSACPHCPVHTLGYCYSILIRWRQFVSRAELRRDNEAVCWKCSCLVVTWASYPSKAAEAQRVNATTLNLRWSLWLHG